MWFYENYHKKTVQKLLNKNAGITSRTIQCGRETVTILYIRQLTNRDALSELVIKPLVERFARARKALKAAYVAESVLYADDCFMGSEDAPIEEYVLDGNTVLIFSNDREYIVANMKQVEHRDVAEPELQYNLRSPRDCFVENLDVNLSLLRYRIKDRNLCIEKLHAGRRTKTNVILVYIRDIAREDCIQELKKRVDAIDTDSILESGELQAFLMNGRFRLLPEMYSIERSDWVAELLMEGKFAVFVEGSALAIVAPVTFVEFMYACDDRYENQFVGTFMRLIRYMAFFISLSASSYWIAMVSFHSDILPAGFIISLAQARTSVPFNALLGVLVLEFIVELIRESLIRVPNKIGSSIAIVSAIIIGQASISAGVFSALLLILISVEFLSSFAIPNQFAANTLRLVKFMLMLLSGVFGFYGFILGITVVVAEMVSINSFGVPYLAPFGPFNLYDFLRTFMFSRKISAKRQQYMRNKDDTRTGQRNK